MHMCSVSKSCPTLCTPGISQARIVEWVAIPFSRGSFKPGIESRSPALQVDSLLSETPGKPKHNMTEHKINSYQLYSNHHHHQQVSIPHNPQTILRSFSFFSPEKIVLKNDGDKTVVKFHDMGSNSLLYSTSEPWFIWQSHLNFLSFDYLCTD